MQKQSLLIAATLLVSSCADVRTLPCMNGVMIPGDEVLPELTLKEDNDLFYANTSAYRKLTEREKILKAEKNRLRKKLQAVQCADSLNLK